MPKFSPYYAVTNSNFLGGVLLICFIVQQIVIGLKHFLIAIFALFHACCNYGHCSQVSAHDVMTPAIIDECLVLNIIRFSHNLCRLAHRPGVLKDCSFVFCYYKDTTFLGNLQVFWGIYVDEIGRNVDVIWLFVGKKRLFR